MAQSFVNRNKRTDLNCLQQIEYIGFGYNKKRANEAYDENKIGLTLSSISVIGLKT